MLGIEGLCCLTADKYESPHGPFPLEEFGDTILDSVSNIVDVHMSDLKRGDMVTCTGSRTGSCIAFVRRDRPVNGIEIANFPVVPLGSSKDKFVVIFGDYVNPTIKQQLKSKRGRL